MPKLMLDRQTLARLLQNDHQAIVAFEKVLGDVGETLPSTLEEVTALASMASSLANLALEMLAKADEQLELLSCLPTPVTPPADDNYIPSIAFGTIGQQNADAVEITGGSIDGTTIGANSASTGAFTTLSATGQITSTLATGTSPLVVASITKVANLNADLLDGTDWTAPGTIGGTTPASARFTTVDATNSTGGAASVAYRLFDASGNYSFGMGPTSTEGFINYNSGTVSNASFGHRWNINGVEVAKVDGTGLYTVASLKSVGGFGCNGQAAQTAYALGAASTDLPTVITLANNIRLALIANGIGS